MPNILITGAWFQNKGAEAMIRSVQNGILDRLPGTTHLLRSERNAALDSETLGGLHLWSMDKKRRIYLGLLCRIGLIPNFRSGSVNSVLRRDLGISAVIDISGYGFGDEWQQPLNWSPSALASSIRQLAVDTLISDNWAIYHALSIPLFHLPQAWGPFENLASQRMAERILRGASKVYARDTVSYEWLRKIPTFSEEKVALASDIAFSFSGAAPEVGRSLLAGIGVRLNEKPIVGIVPNMRVYERAEGHGAQNAYVQRLVAVTRWFTVDRQCQVVLMPHEIKPTNSIVSDDRYLCRIVADAIEDRDTIRAATGDYTAEELKAMIGQMEMLVSSRFHSIIAAMSLRRPVVSLAWSHKYHELMKSVGLGEFVAPHETDTHSLLMLCENAWENKVAMTRLLEEHVPAHEASAANVFREVTEMIRNVI